MKNNGKSKMVDITRLTESLEHYDFNNIYEAIKTVAKDRWNLMKEKDRSYGGSWQQDGFLGAFINLKRKIDRLLNHYKSGDIFSPLSSSSDGEQIIDTFVDMINYAEMNIAFLILDSKTKEEFERFVKVYPSLNNSFYWDADEESVEPKDNKPVSKI